MDTPCIEFYLSVTNSRTLCTITVIRYLTKGSCYQQSYSPWWHTPLLLLTAGKYLLYLQLILVLYISLHYRSPMSYSVHTHGILSVPRRMPDYNDTLTHVIVSGGTYGGTDGSSMSTYPNRVPGWSLLGAGNSRVGGGWNTYSIVTITCSEHVIVHSNIGHYRWCSFLDYHVLPLVFCTVFSSSMCPSSLLHHMLQH